jgi:Leucine-rich repeat (LRR) protein
MNQIACSILALGLSLVSFSVVKPDELNPETTEALAQIKRLGGQVTDAGLEYLQGLTRLQELSLEETDVSDRAVKRLQQALPNCKIRTSLVTPAVELDPKEAAIVTEVKKRGGEATIIETVVEMVRKKSVFGVDLNKTQVTDAWLKHLNGLPNLQSLRLDNTQVTDAGLEHLKGLTSLQSLNLDNTQVTDAGLEHLKGLINLRSLVPNRRKLTDAGLEHLGGMAKLERLNLWFTQVTDAGLKHLEGLTNLQGLALGNTQVTDAGLEHLKGLIELQSVILIGTKVTDAGVKNLQQALPKCKIKTGHLLH